MLQYLILLGAAINILATISYLKSIFYGETRPNRVSWFMWALAPLIVSVAAIFKGVGWAVLPVLIVGIDCLMVFLVSLFVKRSYWKIGYFDYLCGLLSALALVLWAMTNEPNTAILFSILADIAAAIPTLKKAWTNPETEAAALYALGIVSALTAFAAVKHWDFTELGFQYT